MLRRNGRNSWSPPRRNRKGSDGSHRTIAQNLYMPEFPDICKIEIHARYDPVVLRLCQPISYRNNVEKIIVTDKDIPRVAL